MNITINDTTKKAIETKKIVSEILNQIDTNSFDLIVKALKSGAIGENDLLNNEILLAKAIVLIMINELKHTHSNILKEIKNLEHFI